MLVEAGTADAAITTIATTPTDAVQTGGYLAREVVTLPTDFLGVKSVFLVQGTRRTQLSRLAESDRNLDYLYQNGMPRWYEVLDAGQATAARLRLWPRVDSAYSLEVSYYSEAPTLTLVGDLWEYPSGAEDVVIAQVAMRILERDGIPEPNQYSALQLRYDNARSAILRNTKRNAGVRTMRNTRDIARSYRRTTT